jgi:ATP-dependent DNA helicase DinG
MHKWFSPKISEEMRREIAVASGNEVFFCAYLEEGRLARVKVLAKGNRESVPAVVRPEPGKTMLVLHNHPSGDLTPSGADITVASRLAREGIGFAIVDNQVSDCYVVVEPSEPVITEAVIDAEVEEILAPGGQIERAMPGFENRPQQLEMAVSLAQALNNRQHVLAEAGTGTGKSLAYLVPILLWARKNKRRAVVSTNTINLQEQLLYKDIPLLQRAMPGGFKAVLVKGRANYLCRRKFRELLQQGEGQVDEKDIPALEAMAAWEQRTRDGSKSDLGFAPSSHLWELVCSESDLCLRLSCPFFNECFFHNARRSALDAQLLIANHSLLFADIALRSRGAETGVLPEYHTIVLDEAHNIENVATNWLGAQITRQTLSRLLARLWSSRHNRARGLLVVLGQKLAMSPDLDEVLAQGLRDAISQDLVPGVIRLNQDVGEYFTGLETYLGQLAARDFKARLTEDFISAPGWQALVGRARAVLWQMEELGRQLASFYSRLENLGPLGFEHVLAQALELAALAKRLAEQETALKEVLFGDDHSLVRWVELATSRGTPRASLNYAPLSVCQVLRDNIWEKYDSVILTSATLSVGGSFQFVRDRLGLDQDLPVQELLFASPFDFQSRAILGIAMDMPAPDESAYARKLPQAILASLRASQGRALVLFTSFSLLYATAEQIRAELAAMDIALLCQGDMPRHALLEKFRADTRSALMATASFWEGVDVAGESLSNVILTRLPFTVPDEPVVQARIDALRRQDKNPFYAYQVPQAVLRFKQGFGRLIRTKRDMGVVLVLDKRIITKNYGRYFLEALPQCPTRHQSLEQVLSWQRDFLEKK